MSEFEQFISNVSGLGFPVGTDRKGNVVTDDLTAVNHLLVSGISGSGKTAFIDTLLLSFMRHVSPDELRFILCDTKGADYILYNNINHLLVPAVIDPKRIAAALQWTVVECLRRLRLFSEQGARELLSFNKKWKELGKEPLPRIVIVVDDLTAAVQSNPESLGCIQRILSVGRSAGCHLIAVTQTPAIKELRPVVAVFPSKLILQPSSASEYRFLTSSKATPSYIEPGDAMYCHGALQVMVTITTPTDTEIGASLKEQKYAPSDQYDKSLQDELNLVTDIPSMDSHIDESTDYDEFLPQAVEVVLETKQASVSILQRRLKLGYSRSARLLDQLEEVGVVGPYEGSKPRQIVITEQQWVQMQAAPRMADTVDEPEPPTDIDPEPPELVYPTDYMRSVADIPLPAVKTDKASKSKSHTRPRCPACGSYRIEVKETGLLYRILGRGPRNSYQCSQCGHRFEGIESKG